MFLKKLLNIMEKTWLASEIGRLGASGEEFHGPHVDGLKHFLRLAGGADSAVAVQGEALK